jgi:phosphatidylglycerol:prolipoprotein diacylglycerol transferase
VIIYPDIDPIALDLGFLQIRWYGLSYVAGIMLAWWLLGLRAGKSSEIWDKEKVADLVFYCTLGIILGGRLGSVLFYNLPYYLGNPLEIFMVWKGGMAFHGGFLGVMAAIWYFARKQKMAYFQIADFMLPVVPVGLFFGRIANFINGELWGRHGDVPWAMKLPGEALPRHPSQLYEAFLEGALLFIILWIFSSRPRPAMAVSGLFILLYSIFRAGVEFVREPDSHIGYLLGEWLTMGMLLSLPMMIFGSTLLFLAYRGK